MGFHEIRAGSCAIPVERIVEAGASLFPGEDGFDGEVESAAQLIDEAVAAAATDTPFPDHMPPVVLPLFKDWGKTLQHDEAIILTGGRGVHPRFDARVRERLLDRAAEPYEDTIDIVGEVRAAELRMKDGGSFTLLQDNGESVPGVFSDAQEGQVTEALHEHKQVRLRVVGFGEFDTAGRLRRISRVERFEERPLGEPRFDPDATPIWDVVSKIGESVPEEEWGRVPTDLAANLDRYLYGDLKEQG